MSDEELAGFEASGVGRHAEGRLPSEAANLVDLTHFLVDQGLHDEEGSGLGGHDQGLLGCVCHLASVFRPGAGEEEVDD